MHSPVLTDATFFSPSLLEITVKRCRVPGSRPVMWQLKSLLDSPCRSQSADSSSIKTLKLQERPAVVNFTTTESELEVISVKFAEQWEASVELI